MIGKTCMKCGTIIPGMARVCPACTRDLHSGGGSGYTSIGTGSGGNGLADYIAMFMVLSIFIGFGYAIIMKLKTF